MPLKELITIIANSLIRISALANTFKMKIHQIVPANTYMYIGLTYLR